MKPLTFLAICAFLLSGSAPAQSGRVYRAVVQVINQNYCYGDDEVFTVSLDLRIKVVNSARTTLFFASDMVPYSGKVAKSTDAVRAGHYIQEWTPSRYLTEPPPRKAHRIEVKPGHSFVLRVKYGVPGRYRVTPPIAGTLPVGKYALQLRLQPEDLSRLARRSGTRGVELDSLTTEPVLFEIPQGVTATDCR
jgi:hypothetical protein